MGEKASIKKRIKVNIIEYSACVHENAIMTHYFVQSIFINKILVKLFTKEVPT